MELNQNSDQNISPQEVSNSELDSKKTNQSIDKNVKVFYNVLKPILYESRKFVKKKYFYTILKV